MTTLITNHPYYKWTLISVKLNQPQLDHIWPQQEHNHHSSVGRFQTQGLLENKWLLQPTVQHIRTSITDRGELICGGVCASSTAGWRENGCMTKKGQEREGSIGHTVWNEKVLHTATLTVFILLEVDLQKRCSYWSLHGCTGVTRQLSLSYIYYTHIYSCPLN